MNIKIKMTRSVNCSHYNVSKGTVVNVPFEDEYLPICISSEIYESENRTPFEAKKAQAIAARTYAYSHALKGTIIDDTANWQAFEWKNLSSIPYCVKAVQETSSMILICQGNPITAWFSNSNGGRTKRSDEAWSSYKPWTVSKDDPYDVEARKKWGEVKASHSVGMSQIAASYMAYIGKTFIEILMFYYINTDIIDNYGNGKKINNSGGIEKMLEKTNIGLAEWAKNMLGQPYWY